MTQQSPISTPKPCIALMGEFSAGKSTLANLLIGAEPLPVQVVATQLPPVRISYGNDDPYFVDLHGQHHPVSLDRLNAAGLEDALYLQLFCVEDILQQCDILDMPGISDPNMSSEVWERMIDKAHGVIWCSHATQAWRQSEAAVWADLPAEIYHNSLLLLTRVDKIRSAEDRERVLRRVRKETEGLFAAVLPISLLMAAQVEEDGAAWTESGAEEFAKHLVALLARLGAGEVNRAPRLPGLERPASLMSAAGDTACHAQASAGRVTPRRVHLAGSTNARPPRPAASDCPSVPLSGSD